MPKTSDDIRQKRDKQRIEEIKKTSKMNNKSRIIICCVIGVLLLGVVVTVSFVSFKVKNIEVIGDSVYSHEKITDTVQYLLDTSLLSVDKPKAADTITSSLPYIKNVDVSIKLPSTLILNVESNNAAFAVRVSNGYVLIDDNYKCIEKTEKSNIHPVIYGVNFRVATPGRTVQFADSAHDKIVRDVVSAILKNGAKEITQINLEDEYNIVMIYSTKHLWKIGDSSNIDYKIRYGKTVSEKENGSGTVDLSMLQNKNNKAYFTSGTVKTTFEKEQPNPVSSTTSPSDQEVVSSKDSEEYYEDETDWENTEEEPVDDGYDDQMYQEEDTYDDETYQEDSYDEEIYQEEEYYDYEEQ